jgi:hypothetical protein
MALTLAIYFGVLFCFVCAPFKGGGVGKEDNE